MAKGRLPLLELAENRCRRKSGAGHHPGWVTCTGDCNEAKGEGGRTSALGLGRKKGRGEAMYGESIDCHTRPIHGGVGE